uniref:(northern house mosquito) hypothetical protein n=1 Tax=Culex pipiens TaxID=7175 RepID=A0A8D8C7E8_CULPI
METTRTREVFRDDDPAPSSCSVFALYLDVSRGVETVPAEDLTRSSRWSTSERSANEVSRKLFRIPLRTLVFDTGGDTRSPARVRFIMELPLLMLLFSELCPLLEISTPARVFWMVDASE